MVNPAFAGASQPADRNAESAQDLLALNALFSKSFVVQDPSRLGVARVRKERLHC
jgi:hypothetical protein